MQVMPDGIIAPSLAIFVKTVSSDLTTGTRLGAGFLCHLKIRNVATKLLRHWYFTDAKQGYRMIIKASNQVKI